MKKILTLTALVASFTAVSQMTQSYFPERNGMINLFVSPALAAQTKTYHMRVDGITCPFCVKTSEKSLRRIPGVKRVSTNLKKGVITVCATPAAKITSGKMRSLFRKKGFTFRSMRTGRSC